MLETSDREYSLTSKARQAGIFAAQKGCLIAAPTATGKSYIGVQILKENLPRKPASEIFLYLVPFKALAEEMYQKIKDELPQGIRTHIKTSDYDTQFRIEDTDVLVATYESIAGLITEGKEFYPSIIIADELSIVGQPDRGPRIESLISHLAKSAGTVFFGLSAVLSNPDRVSQWLGINLLEGQETDRPVPLETKVEFYRDRGRTVEQLVRESLKLGSVLIFCGTKREVERQCRALAQSVRSSMTLEERDKARNIAESLERNFNYLLRLPDLVRSGIAYHHAGLELGLRKVIAEAFNNRIIKVLVATTTLSAGINLPARAVIVRDLLRYTDRGPLLSVSEIVNMLGRAGRPRHDKAGTGYLMVAEQKKGNQDYRILVSRIRKREVEQLQSQIPESLTGTLQFILSTASRLKGMTDKDLIDAYNDTLWGFQNSLNPPLLSGNALLQRLATTLGGDPTVQLSPSTIKVEGDILKARGGTKNPRDYEIQVAPRESRCSCKSWTLGKKRPCKHIKQLVYEALHGRISQKNPAAMAIALSCLEETADDKDPMYRLAKGVKILLSDGFLEDLGGRLQITADGRQALINYLLSTGVLRILRDRLRQPPNAKDENDIVDWVIQDYGLLKQCQDFASLKRRLLKPELLEKAIKEHIKETPYQKLSTIKWTQIQSFLDTKDFLDQMLRAYLTFVPPENADLPPLIRCARRRIHYGCRKDLIALMILDLEGFDVQEARTLFDHGIPNVKALAETPAPKIARLLAISMEQAEDMVKYGKTVCQLLEAYNGERSQLMTLAARTGVSHENLLDYLLPPKLAEALRKPWIGRSEG